MQRYVAAFILLAVFFLASAAPAFVQEENPVRADASGQAKTNPDSEEGLRSEKPPERPVGTPFYIKLLRAAAAALVSILAFCAIYRHFRKKIEEKQKPPPPVPPEKAAYDALKQIRELMDSDGKAFYFRLSLALREYIGRRFSINAAEMTSEELFPVLRSLPLEEDLASDARRFFGYSDPVKYAGAVPERTRMERHIKFVRLFVKKTTDTISPEKIGAGELSHSEKATGID